MRRCRFLAPSLRGSLRAAFSSDGKRAAVLREGGAIDLWQADAGAASRGDWLRVSVVEVGASAALSCLAWCQPRGGAGETLLAGSMDGSVRHVRAGLVGRRTALADGVSLVVAGGKEVVAATVAVASSKKSKRSRAEAASAPVKVSEAVTETDEVASLDVLEDGSVCVGEVADDVAAALAPPSLRTRQFAV
ncbi:hypothetical protein FNF28_06768 [Cafeteria roenbergensis]|uniref:Uncharacterized protein n=1 Tax=Cafeteria roenbergensis TaxID=33653 RepID=A0A5A8CR83_CAFRO|nr:hypothetical protein FNF28_06768 [Cafeteria roenbergensis]